MSIDLQELTRLVERHRPLISLADPEDDEILIEAMSMDGHMSEHMAREIVERIRDGL